jgi:hypothetical protein
MDQVFSQCFISAHREGQLALRSGETAGSLDDPMPQGVKFLKRPGDGTFRPGGLGGQSFFNAHNFLKPFPAGGG